MFLILWYFLEEKGTKFKKTVDLFSVFWYTYRMKQSKRELSPLIFLESEKKWKM